MRRVIRINKDIPALTGRPIRPDVVESDDESDNSENHRDEDETKDSDDEVIEHEGKYRKSEMENFLYDKHIKAAESGDLPLLIQLQKKTGTVGNRYACSMAASRGHLHIVKYMHTQGIILDELISFKACISGNIELLKYLHENKCPGDDECITMIIENGHVEALEYLLDNEVHINERDLHAAIAYGNIEMVKLISSYGHEILEEHIYTAIEGYNEDEYASCRCSGKDQEVYLEILKYLLTCYEIKTNGYFRCAIMNNKLKIARWLVDNGYPIVYTPTDNPYCEYFQHKICHMKCEKECMYCIIDKMKKCRVGLYNEDGYGSWLSTDMIEKLIKELY